VAEGEQPQERPQRGWGAHPGEQPAHSAVSQQIHIGDRVRAADHPGDQREDLGRGVRTALCGDRESIDEQGGQAATLRQCHHRHQPGA
jgi:hypothetical protein